MNYRIVVDTNVVVSAIITQGRVFKALQRIIDHNDFTWIATPEIITGKFPRDPKDEKFIDCIVGANADFFLTGDRDFADANLPETVQVVTVTQFLAMFPEEVE